MQLEEAKKIADHLISNHLGIHFTKYLICGSIRRKCNLVRDIDIVAITKPESEYKFGDLTLGTLVERMDMDGVLEAKKLGKRGASRFLNGKAIKRFKYKEMMIDLYLANERTFETLVLIRTGSKEHNIKLTTFAKMRGQKLFADGTGLCKMFEGSILSIIDTTEDGILKSLLDRIPKPEERN